MKVKMSYGLLLAEEICSLLYPWSVKIDNGSGTRKHGVFWVSFAKMLANFIIIFQSNSPKVSRIYEKKNHYYMPKINSPKNDSTCWITDPSLVKDRRYSMANLPPEEKILNHPERSPLLLS